MWTERVASPDGQWLVALNGQASIEVRHRERLGEREMLTWSTGIPKGYGFWMGKPGIFLVSTEEGITEIWDFEKAQRLAYTPEAVGESSYTSHWPPALPDESHSLQLILTRAVWHEKGQGPRGEFRPLGRYPVAGGGLGYDMRSALVVTGRRPDKPQPDAFIGGEVIRYDMASSRPTAAAAHNIHSERGMKVLANPALSHLFVNTSEGALFCLEAASGRTVYCAGYQPTCTTAMFSHDGKRCLAGLENGEVQLVGETGDQVVWGRRAHEFAVLNGGISRDGLHAVTIGVDRSFVCWDAVRGTPLAGAPPRYDRVKDPLPLIVNPHQAVPDVQGRLGPTIGSVLVGESTFTIDYAGNLYRFPFDNLAQPVSVWQGTSAPAPDGTGYVVYETISDEKKKSSKLGIFQLNPRTGEKTPLATVDAPADAQAYPLFINPKRCLLPRKEGGLMLLRLDKKLFHRDSTLDTGTIRVTTMGFHVAADASVFALSHGAELRVYRTDDGKLLGDFVLEVPRREKEPAVVGCWLGSGGKEIAVMLQSGTLQRWKM